MSQPLTTVAAPDALRGCHPVQRVDDYLTHGSWRHETILDLFDRQVRERGDAPAVTDPPNLAEVGGRTPESLTWFEIERRVIETAARLHAHGIRRGDVVAILLPNSVALTATYLALWKLGAIASPMPTAYRMHEMRRIAQASGATAVITTTHVHDRAPHEEFLGLQAELPSLRTVFTFGPTPDPRCTALDEGEVTDRQVREVLDAISAVPRSVNDCVTICWTSGTEASPKGVPRCHGDWLAIAQVAQDGLDTTADSVMVAPFPMVNMAGFATSLLPWVSSGAHLVHHHPLALPVFLGQLQSHRATHTSVPPALLGMLLQNPDLRARFDLSALRTVGSGGAPLPPPVVRAWQEELGIHVVNFFGSNEGICLLGAPSDTPDPLVRAAYLPNYGATNRTWATPIAAVTSVRLVDLVTDEVVTELGGRGELRLKGPTVFAGYLEGTAEIEPFDEDGYLRTGDVFELAGESGEYLKFVDRSKEIIIRGGMNIAPAEIEGVLSSHPAIAEVAIIGYDDPILTERCCAVVVPRADHTVTLDAVVAHLKAADVASFKLPEKLVVAEQLPRNPTGKLLRRELRATVAGQE